MSSGFMRHPAVGVTVSLNQVRQTSVSPVCTPCTPKISAALVAKSAPGTTRETTSPGFAAINELSARPAMPVQLTLLSHAVFTGTTAVSMGASSILRDLPGDRRARYLLRWGAVSRNQRKAMRPPPPNTDPALRVSNISVAALTNHVEVAASCISNPLPGCVPVYQPCTHDLMPAIWQASEQSSYDRILFAMTQVQSLLM